MAKRKLRLEQNGKPFSEVCWANTSFLLMKIIITQFIKIVNDGALPSAHPIFVQFELLNLYKRNILVKKNAKLLKRFNSFNNLFN